MSRASAVRALLFALLFSVLATSGAAEEPRTFSAEDLVRLVRLSQPALAPDGRSVAYTVRETDLEADRGRTDLWLLDLTVPGAVPRRLTSHPENDSSPRWSADGRALYFLSSRSGSSQVWRLPMSAGEASQVTDLPVDIGTFRLAPDGSQLAVTLEVFPDCADLACTKDRLTAAAQSKTTGAIHERLFLRHWDTWKDGRQSQLFAIPLENGRAAAAPTALSASLDADVPSKPFGDASEYTFSPDGARIVFAARLKGQSEAWSTNFDLWEVPTDASSAPVNLTADNPAWDTQPVFSADGSLMAWRAMERPGFESDRFHIELLDLKTGERRRLAADWDRSALDIAFAADGSSIYATADHFGQRPLWKIDLESGRSTMLTGPGHVEEFSAGADQIVYTLATLEMPADLHSLRLRDGAIARLTRANAERLADVRLGKPVQFSFAGWEDETVYAHVVAPAAFEPGRKYPVAFIVHGGPQVSYGNLWSYRWNPQTYAGAGYGVVFVDFHGSPGYGQAFTDSISGDWGDKPLVDLKKGLAAALEKYPWLDGERVCALGASYGGYMINWIAGNWSEPFRCLVSHAGIFDNRFMAYSTEELWFDEWEFGGPPWEAAAKLEQHNPVNHVADWRTPMLVIHGANDFRVPYSQGIATFTALQRRGIPSRFIFYPDENHWILKPANSLQWHREVERWLAEHLKD